MVVPAGGKPGGGGVLTSVWGGGLCGVRGGSMEGGRLGGTGERRQRALGVWSAEACAPTLEGRGLAAWPPGDPVLWRGYLRWSSCYKTARVQS